MRKKILVIYDIPQQRAEIVESLSEHKVVSVESYTEAHRLLSTKPEFDLIVCAASLRDGSIFDLLKMVKDDPATRQCLFLVVCFKPGQLARYFIDTVFSTAQLLGADHTLFSVGFEQKHFKEAVAQLLSPPTAPYDKSQRVSRERGRAASAVLVNDLSAAEIILRQLHASMVEEPASFQQLDVAIVQQDLIDLLEKSGKPDEAAILREKPCDF